jgi:hypothetical protein
MHATLLEQHLGTRSFLLVYGTDDQVGETLLDFARREGIGGAWLTGIGALRSAIVAYWNWKTKQYEEIAIEEQVEVVSFTGNIALEKSGPPRLHAHVVLSKQDGSTVAGHFVRGVVRPTLEIRLVAYPVALRRSKDPATGLWLIEPAADSGGM